ETPLLWMSANEPPFGSGAASLVQLSPGSPLRVASRPSHVPGPTPTSAETSAALARSRTFERAGQLHDALKVLERPAVTAPLDAAAQLARGLLLKQLGRIGEAVQALRAARFL